MTKIGKLFFTLIVLVVAAFGIYRWMNHAPVPQGGGGVDSSHSDATVSTGGASGADEFDFLVPGPAPKLSPAQTYQPADNTVVINLSEYAGYAGLILANVTQPGGAAPGFFSPRCDAATSFVNWGWSSTATASFGVIDGCVASSVRSEIVIDELARLVPIEP